MIKITRLRTRLLLGAMLIGIGMALTSMLAVSWVISGQYLGQATTFLGNATRVINDNLTEREHNQLAASMQLAAQKNLGSTIWYLTQYDLADVNRDLLFATYKDLLRDIYNIGRVAKLSAITIYDAAGQLITFTRFDGDTEQLGFAEHNPVVVIHVATLRAGEELSKNNTRAVHAVAGINSKFAGVLPQHEVVHYTVRNGHLLIESEVPVMGDVFDAGTGKPEQKQLGLVVTEQLLANVFVDQLVNLTNTAVNIFTPQGLSSGSLPAYRTLNQPTGARALNEIEVGGERYYQTLIPLYREKQIVATIAVLNSQGIVRKNTREMVGTLGMIALASLLLILPFAWYLATTISRPLSLLSGIFRGVASGKEILSGELGALSLRRGDELGDLAGSFIAMNQAIKQKIQQINEINATLEEKIDQRTRELRLANDELTKLASHDVLTGLPNRQLVSDRLDQALALARRDKSHLAVMFIDLDEFKPVNDSFGHDVGDLLLKEVAKRIQDCLRATDTVSRIGGDEFIVLLPIIEASHDAEEVAEKIRQTLHQTFELANHVLQISASIGIAIYPEHGSDQSTLLKHADMAMYLAKDTGRNRVQLFESLTK